MRRRGFTLLEVLVATTIMAIAVVGLLSAISASLRNAARLTGYDRAVMLARAKMDALLVDPRLPRQQPLQGVFHPAEVGGESSGWRAVLTVHEIPPHPQPGQPALERVQLEIWWMEGGRRRALALEGFRRGVLQPQDVPGGAGGP